jgi:hypothetical protein
MEPRSDDQPNPERETARNDPEAGKHAAESNATPDPRGGAQAEPDAFDRSPEAPPKR